MNFKSWGIKERAIFLALAPAIMIAAALTVYFLLLRYADVDEALHNRGQVLVRQLAPAAEYGAFAGNRAELSRLLDAAASEPDVVAISIYDAGGRLLATAGSPTALADPATLAAQGGHRRSNDGKIDVFHATIQRPVLSFEDPFQTEAHVKNDEERPLGSVVLELSRRALEARKREILTVTLAATLAVLIIAMMLARRLGRDITEPVLALEDAVARIRGGDLDARAPRHSSGTLASLELGFNDMAAELAQSHRRSASALATSEAELRRQHSFAQTLLDAQSDAGVGLMIIDEGKVTFANRAIDQIFGYAPGEIAALPTFLNLVHPDDRMRIMDNHLRRLRGETLDSHYDVTLLRKNGEAGCADLAVAVLAAGDHMQILCVVVDITERKRAETQLTEAHAELLAKKEEAERASAAKSRFLAAASHDLRQPLHALSLFAADLEATATAPPGRRLAGQIVTAAGAMSELLDALLEVSRLDIAALEPHRQPVALAPLLDDIVAAQRQSAQARGLHLICRPTEAWVDTDPQLLRRMVGNLVSNAIRYTNRGGILIGVRRQGERIRLEVWDTGIGIDATHLPHLFQEFYQVGNPERDSAKGLGLGLAIVDRLGQILGHSVTVHSREGRGSVFSISLPRAEPAMTAAAAAAPESSRDARLAVYCSGETCDSLCGLLGAWGYERDCAHSEADLLRLLQAKPAAMICDSGLLPELARCLPAGFKQPLLVVLGEEEAIPERLHVHGRLPKPARPAPLRALLRHLLLEEGGAAPELSPSALRP